jgi:hypothetical protein
VPEPTPPELLDSPKIKKFQEADGIHAGVNSDFFTRKNTKRHGHLGLFVREN